MLTPALYRTRITHLRRAPVHHYFEHRGYSWYVDIDQLPQLPRWLRPFARFDARDHLEGGPNTHCANVSTPFWPSMASTLCGGRVTALMQARVLGYVFNPLTLYWCHDATVSLRHVVAEVHNTYGGRHAYLLPPPGDQPRDGAKKLYVSPFNDVDGHYLVRAPRPAGSRTGRAISLHREDQPAFVATLRGTVGRRHCRPGAQATVRRAAGAADGRDRNPRPGNDVVAATRPRRGAHRVSREAKSRTAVTIELAETDSTAIDPEPLAGRGQGAPRPAGRGDLPSVLIRSGGGTATGAAGLSGRHGRSAPPIRPCRRWWSTVPTRWPAGSADTG